MLIATRRIPALVGALDAARRETDRLFELIRPDAWYQRPIPERHRLIFYLGHVEAFDWNQMCRAGLDAPSFHATFDRLFEFGIDPPIGKAPDDSPSAWPSVDEVRAYNARARKRVDSLLDDVPPELLNMAVEHRLMHAETFAYLMHNLAYEYKAPVRKKPPAPAEPLQPQTIELPAGNATLGQKTGEFGWDNEFDAHVVAVPAFAISKHKVTNGEYLRFVQAGAAHPHFWIQRQNKWFYRGMFGEEPLPLDSPVYVTYQQATAYAEWQGKALPGEPQYHRAAYGTFAGRERVYPWGDEQPKPARGNFDFRDWDPVNVTADPAGDSAFGVSQLLGNGWEWTSTPFGPFPGFRPFPTYPGYSQNFFDGRHYILKGASPRTAGCFLRRSFRNWFRADYPYAYACFRLV